MKADSLALANQLISEESTDGKVTFKQMRDFRWSDWRNEIYPEDELYEAARTAMGIPPSGYEVSQLTEELKGLGFESIYSDLRGDPLPTVVSLIDDADKADDDDDGLFDLEELDNLKKAQNLIFEYEQTSLVLE